MKKEDKKIGIVIGVAFLLLAIYLAWGFSDRYYYFGSDNAKRKKRIATVVKIKVGGRVSPSFEYEFYVNNISYKSSESLPDNLSIQTKSKLEKYIGKRYFVIYSVEKPKYSELLIEKGAVKNASLIAPDTGWLENERIPNYPVRVD